MASEKLVSELRNFPEPHFFSECDLISGQVQDRQFKQGRHGRRKTTHGKQLWRTTSETDLPELIGHIQATWELRVQELSYIKILGGGG